MPKVESYDNFKIGVGNAPGGGFINAATPAKLNVGAEQLQEQGKAVMDSASQQAAVVIDANQMANSVRVADAANKFKEYRQKLTYDKDMGYTNVKGIDAFERQSGKPLADEYTENLKNYRDQIAAGLSNEVQRQAFNADSDSELTTFHGQTMAHETGEFRNYTLSVRDGTVANSINDIELNYDKPDVIDKNVALIQSSIYDKARLEGKSATEAEALSRDMTSKAHSVAIETALNKNNPLYADEYKKKYAPQMNANDILQVDGKLTKELDNKIGLTVAGKVIQNANQKLMPSDADRAFNVAVGTESNNNQFGPDGVTPLTSPKGAIGIAQVMPGTAPEAAKMAGLEWDEKRYKTDPAYNKAIGQAYFNQQVKDFDGSLAKAYAAYNAGPGAVRKAMKAAEKDAPLVETQNPDGSYDLQPDLSNINWLAKLPKETQNYVAKNMKEYADGGGAPQKPTLLDIQNDVRKELGADASPTRLKVALDEAERQFNDTTKAMKQRNDEATANAMRAVEQNGGSFANLPAQVRGSIPIEDTTKVMDFAKRVALGDDSTDLRLYQRLSANPEALKDMSDNEFYALKNGLSNSDFKHFSDERAKLITGQVSNTSGDINSGTMKTALDDRLRMLKIDPTPKDGSKDAVRVGAIRKFVLESIASAQMSAGKKFNDVETSQYIDFLFAKNASYDGTWFLGGDSSGPMLGMKTGDIPSSEKNDIEEAFKKAGNNSPTDADIMNVYWRKLTMKPVELGSAQ